MTTSWFVLPSVVGGLSSVCAGPRAAWRPLETRVRCPELRSDRCEQRSAAEEVHDAGEIVGEDVQRHLAGDARKRLH
jgi:hypothetical protein